MHPYAHHQVVAFRAEQSRRAALARHHPLIREPSVPLTDVILLFITPGSVLLRLAAPGIKQAVGLALIRVGLRFVDPTIAVRSIARR
ncbi:hypothetical protein [Euzebya tangerina]|uniref:hypothetical protein n=1 Tax=Euzebya tangerina TaxID=591198 RepID=UPI000E31B9F7|nr:hypothetical protein [Euzebya tangerina]